MPRKTAEHPFSTPPKYAAGDPSRVAERNSVIREGRIVCDSCTSVITRMTEVPAEGWPQLHNLCSACFAKIRAQAVAR
ncbi:MAG: prepilin peptidase [Thermoplasmata archaeon]